MQSRRRGRDSESRRRQGVEQGGDGKEEKHDDEEDLGERRLLVASPPLGKKRLSGARPFVGRPPPPSPSVQREGPQDGEGYGSRLASQASSCGVKGMRDEDDGNTISSSRQHFRSASVEDEKAEQMDTDAPIIRTRISGCDGEHGATHAARGKDWAGLDANDELVRTVAESFVGNVLGDSTASSSRLTLK